jgi:hypothetical protein
MGQGHLLYLRYAFPLEHEPGPKRHLDIVRFMVIKGHPVSVISAATNFMTGDSGNPFRGRLFQAENIGGFQLIRVRTIKDYRSSVLRRISSYFGFSLLSCLRGFQFMFNMNRGPITILVDVSPVSAVVAAYLLSRFKDVRLVLEVTDLPETIFALGLFNNSFARGGIAAFFRYVYDHSNAIIALTPGAKRHIEQQGVDSRKVYLIPNWFSDQKETIHLNQICLLREEKGWKGKFVILYAGGHGLAYDLMTMIKAAKYLSNKKDIVFVFVGNGERKAEYVDYCTTHGLNNCQFLPPVSREEINKYIASADVCTNLFYQGSFWTRVVGHKIFDYFANAKPIIFAGEGDTADIIQNAGGGIVVEPGNIASFAEAVLSLYSDQKRATQMGLSGQCYLKEHYNKKQLLSDLEQILFPGKVT